MEAPHQALVQSWLTLIWPPHSHSAMGHCSSVPSHAHSVLKPPGQIIGIGVNGFWQNQVGTLELKVDYHFCSSFLDYFRCCIPWICDEYFIVLAHQLTALSILWSTIRKVIRQHAEEGLGAVIIHKQLAPALPACAQRVLGEKIRMIERVRSRILLWKCICPPCQW